MGMRTRQHISACYIGPPDPNGYPGQPSKDGEDGTPGQPGKHGRPADEDRSQICERECPLGKTGDPAIKLAENYD
uniref:Nematode cuticle collagen N-terminal domain-containing protein n=1 Tax=Angiostrongylus cantonensis TaxID=6313 RepID=A0A158P7E4_ANGCA